jgi:hypothetical protein
MTPEQEIEFKNYGCVCRCLLALTNIAGNPMTKAQFIDKFSAHPSFNFWQEKKRCGATDTGLIVDIIRELNLGKSFQVFLNKDEVRKRIENRDTSGILFFTEKKDETDGTTSPYYHCRLLGLQVRVDGGLSAIEIDDDIKPMIPPIQITDIDVDRLGGYFLSLS